LNAAKKTLAKGMSEAEAIAMAAQGDHECFKALYNRHKRRVYGLCLRMLGNTETAEDLTQEAFLLLHRKIGTFRGDSAFSTWLHRLTVNIVLMHVRKKRLSEISLDEPLDADDDGAGGAMRDYVTEDPSLAGIVDRVSLEHAIERLADGYRIVFVLHDIEGYEHGEIAEMLGCSIGNSKSHLHNARMNLRQILRVTRTENARVDSFKAARAPMSVGVEMAGDSAADAA
jgi:RNA polymerase sigma-70 factor (ECF subfamily)